MDRHNNENFVMISIRDNYRNIVTLCVCYVDVLSRQNVRLATVMTVRLQSSVVNSVSNAIQTIIYRCLIITHILAKSRFNDL